MIKKLGCGCMRLPLLDKNDQTSFDTELLNKMVDTFIEKAKSREWARESKVRDLA